MSRSNRTVGRLVLALALLTAPSHVGAQSVTTGAIRGRVLSAADSVPLASATIEVTSASTGQTFRASTGSSGWYLIQNLPVGVPYVVSAEALGYHVAQRSEIRFLLGQVVREDFHLVLDPVTIEGLDISIERGRATPGRIDFGKNGTASSFSEATLARLPTLDRDFTSFVALTPQMISTGQGPSGGGVNYRYNNIQIDGATESDWIQLGATGQPGAFAGARSISLEAVRQYQVLLSPFDVRYGNFAGALINAVTKSGSNEITGSAYSFYTNEKFARDVPELRSTEFDRAQYGFSIGGPIRRDRAFFFVSAEIQHEETPATGPFLGQDEPLYVAQDSIDRFRSLLESYGLESGTAERVVNGNPLANLFARVDVNLPGNARLVIRNNYARAENQEFSRSSSPTGGVFDLTSGVSAQTATKNSTVLQLFSDIAGGANELIIGYNRIRDHREVDAILPEITVGVSSAAGSPSLRAGPRWWMQGDEKDQDIFELSTNYTRPIQSHSLTLGARAEIFRLRNLFAGYRWGAWRFGSLDAFERGEADQFDVGVNISGEGDGAALLRGGNFSLYAQDFWIPSERLSIYGGLRIDVQSLWDSPTQNPELLAATGYDTRALPSGQLQFSPRIGFALDPEGLGRSQVRGGVGLFTGRPAYVWWMNTFLNNGIDGFSNLRCTPANGVPAFTPQAGEDAPESCLDGTTPASAGDIYVISPDTKLPQMLRASLAVERQLATGWVASLEGLYTKAVHDYAFINRVLAGPRYQDRHGRVVMGTIDEDGIAAPDRIAGSSRSKIVSLENHSQSYSYNLTGALRVDRGPLAGSLSYTYSRARDIQTTTSSRPEDVGRSIGGNPLEAFLTPSKLDQPHRIVGFATYEFPTGTTASLTYQGQSGRPFEYVYAGGGGRGDLNADGYVGNDPVHIPRDARDPDEILFAGTATEQAEQAAAFEDFIDRHACLSSQRGSVMRRNSCREPWTNLVNLAVEQELPTIRGQHLSVRLDIYNLLNLVNADWGAVRTVGVNYSVNLLNHVGQVDSNDPAASRGAFRFDPTFDPFAEEPTLSNYRFQLGLRYVF